MTPIRYRVVESFPEPAFSTLVDQAFSDYQESELLSDVAREEAAARSASQDAVVTDALRIGAFRGETLIGWTFALPHGASHLWMVNSGVAATERRQGVYSALARMVIEHARSKGYVAILSRHAANNNAVIVAKLNLG